MKKGIFDWITSQFFPWLNWFCASLVNGILFVILLGVAFYGGVYFVETRLEQKTIEALCIEARMANGPEIQIIKKKK